MQPGGVLRRRRRPHGPDQVAAFLSRHRGVDHSSIAEALYAGRGKQAAHHLAATAAGMRSLILGEAQIQGQVRDALRSP